VPIWQEPAPLLKVIFSQAFLSGRNERTIKAYSQDLADFQAFMGAATVDDAAKMLLANGHGPANAAALAYKTHPIERGLQSATVNRRLAALRSPVQLARIMGLAGLYKLVQAKRNKSPVRIG
jgi:integrase/recombinase XerC